MLELLASILLLCLGSEQCCGVGCQHASPKYSQPHPYGGKEWVLLWYRGALMGDVFLKSPYTLCQNTLQSNLSHQAALLGLSEQTGAQGVMQGGSSVMLLFSSVQIIYANSFRFGFKF